MKKANPVAFESLKQSKPQIDENMLSETLSDVRYVAQRGKYADFVLMYYHYPARAAHGMYHNEYICRIPVIISHVSSLLLKTYTNVYMLDDSLQSHDL
jgi:hypothetical protein